jgi:hypothetical protein
MITTLARNLGASAARDGEGLRGQGPGAGRRGTNLILEGQELLIVWDLLGKGVGRVHLLWKENTKSNILSLSLSLLFF